MKSIDLYNYIVDKCDNKIEILENSNCINYYVNIKELIIKNLNAHREFYFFIKELSWSNIITLVELLKKPRKSELYNKLGIQLEELNQIRILRNSLAHGDYIIIYLNKQVYDNDTYDKLNVINLVRKILKKYNLDSQENENKFSKIYVKHLKEFNNRKEYI